MVTTTYDISEITESLVTALTNASSSSPMWKKNGGTIPTFIITPSSSSPESVRASQQGDCQLSLYLLHVGQNPFLRNTPVLGTTALRNTQQPLALDLSYLLTAFAGDNADREQQAMSVALRCFHEQPISTASGQYLTVTVGTDTLEEMSRLWQSFTCAYRLSAIVRVAVALMTPSQPPDTASPPPRKVDIAVAPAAAPLAATPQLFGPSRAVSLAVPAGSTDPTQVVTTAAPLVATAGARLLVGGQGLSGSLAINVFLGTLDGTPPWNVTQWRANATLDAELVLNLPTTYSLASLPAVPANLPPPGVYLLAVGGAAPAPQSPAIPLVIAPLLGTLTSAAGVYTGTGAGFVPTATQVWIGGTALQPVAAPPAPATGGFTVSPDGTSISFSLPPGQPPGPTTVRVRVDGVDAPPAWHLVAP